MPTDFTCKTIKQIYGNSLQFQMSDFIDTNNSNLHDMNFNDVMICAKELLLYTEHQAPLLTLIRLSILLRILHCYLTMLVDLPLA